MATIANFGVPSAADGQAGIPLLMPKLAYRFRVTMYDFGAAKVAQGASTLTSQVVSVTRPNLTHEEVLIDVYNSKIYLAGKHTWDPITLTVRDDVDSWVVSAIGSQLQKQLNHGGQSAPLAAPAYKFAMEISALDGGNGGVTGGAGEMVMDSWDFAGCFIQNVQYGENNYATSDVVTITLQIRFDNADQTVLRGMAGPNRLLSDKPTVTNPSTMSSVNGIDSRARSSTGGQ